MTYHYLLPALLLATALSAWPADAASCGTGWSITPQGECKACPPSDDNGRPCPQGCETGSAGFADDSCTSTSSSDAADPASPAPADPASPAPAPAPSPAASPTTIVPSTISCELSGSCSPLQCVVSEDATCAFRSSAPIDWASKVAEMTCKTCEQSTAARCQRLASSLKQDAGVKAAYCNDEFLVIWANGLPSYDPNADEYLGAIPLPPGGDAGCRVRTAAEKLSVYKIPLTTTVQSGDNYLPSPLPGVPGMPAAGAIGVAIDGTPLFPNYNNRGQFAWTSCEVDVCNAHSGKGEDYHLHGDPFGPMCLYDATDYAGLAHPPLFGFALDGYEIFGRHTVAGLQGEATALDDCGGHEHDGLGYHYHAQVEYKQTTSLDGAGNVGGTVSYVAYLLAPTTCWRGNVDVIEHFWAGSQANYDRSKNTALNGWSDLELLRPCCGTSSYYTADGSITIDGATAAPDADEEEEELAVKDGVWSEFGACSAECGGGTETRVCAPPTNGGQDCQGAATQPCNQQPCPVGGDVATPEVAAGASVVWTPTVVKRLGGAFAEAVAEGDGAGIDMYFRNSGVVVKDGSYWGVNGVHPVRNGDLTSYYPKSVVKGSIATDALEARSPFVDAFDHDIDMEALTFGPDGGQTYLYIGDEYNFIYQMRLSDGALTQHWDLGTVGISTSTDKGVESLAYAADSGLFYAGIQGTAAVLALKLDLASGAVTLVSQFTAKRPPSGMFYYAPQQALYILQGTYTNGDQYLSKYSTDGVLACDVTIPASVGLSRTDGFAIEGEFAYIADSQGPMWGSAGSLGHNLFQVQWDNPCGGAVDAGTAEEEEEEAEDEELAVEDGVWSEFGACSAECGGGTETRVCAPPTNGGQDCQGAATQPCNPQACPVDGVWSEFGACSAECGGGSQERECTEPKHGGQGCQGMATQPCNQQACPTVDDVETVAPTSATEAPAVECTDSAVWFQKGKTLASRGCSYVAKKPSKRCNRMGDDGTRSSKGCPVACSTCAAAEVSEGAAAPAACEDSPTWYKSNNAAKDCGWVAKNPSSRCAKWGQGSQASVSCPVACGGCPSVGMAAAAAAAATLGGAFPSTHAGDEDGAGAGSGAAIGVGCAMSVLGLIGAALVVTRRRAQARADAATANGDCAAGANSLEAEGLRLDGADGADDGFAGASSFILSTDGQSIRAASIKRANPVFRHSIVDGVTVGLSPV